MKKRAAFKACLLICLIGLLLWLLWQQFWPTPWRRPWPAPYSALKTIDEALADYWAKYRCYPYSARGEEAALYLLKEFAHGYRVDGASIFDAPEADESPGGPAEWDNWNQVLRGGDYEYANTPPEEQDSYVHLLVLLAEKPGVRATLRYYLTRGGGIFSIVGRHPKHPRNADFNARLVGKVVLTGRPGQTIFLEPSAWGSFRSDVGHED